MFLTKSNPVITRVSLDNLFDRFFQDGISSNGGSAFIPAADVSENEKAYEIQLALPGMKKDDFKINLEENQLTIGGERVLRDTEKGKTWHKIQSQYGHFSRSFYLPEQADASRIKAGYSDGILTVVIPKDEAKALRATIPVH